MSENFTDKKNKHECEICHMIFETANNLKRHTERKNKCIPIDVYQNKFKCEICDKQFNQKSHYERHMNRKRECKPKIMHVTLNDLNKFKQIENNYEQMKDEIEKMKNIFMEKISGDTQITGINSNNTNSNNQTIDNSNNTQAIDNSNTMNNMSAACLINYVINNYPNAKNIEDCIKLENIPRAMLIDCEDYYFNEGAMIIFKGLCDIGEENRPIHCTDASRGNYIYKTNDVWKIDVGGEAIRAYFFPVIQDAYTQVHKKRIKNNPGNSTIIGNFLTEMTSINVKKICQKTLKRLSNDFLAKNSKNSKMIKGQKPKEIPLKN